MQAQRFQAFDDMARAEGGGFHQRSVNLLGGGLQRHAQNHTGKVGVVKHGAVPVPPIQGYQPALAGLQLSGPAIHNAENAAVILIGLIHTFFGRQIGNEPIKYITYGRLACFVAIIARQDAILHHTADAFCQHFLLADHNVAKGGAHGHHHGIVLGNPYHRHGGMGVNDADGHAGAGL
ncbi:hypothetical protein SDC9_181199 [bioreactor metagenome]|uniref:Uncharacterized protein n=1 Tax=bioreactor metagenome TaxID=1076179 RepID=A0A645H3V7_9ZZZZ